MTETVEFLSVEHRNNTLVLDMAVLHYGIIDNLSMRINILQLMPRDIFQESRNREDGARRKPTACMVAADVVEHGVVGYLKDIVLQLLEIMNTHNLFSCMRVAEDKVAKAHMLFHQPSQVETHFLGVLVDKVKTFRFSLGPILRFGTLHDERHILVLATYGTQEFHARLGVFRAIHGETGIADNTQHIVGITLIHGHCLFVTAGQHHFWTSTHTQSGRMAV